ncbi:MAG: restriction endonuclease subunit S [Syntrophomonadaceae bacterium]|nr:restriction endonuclease subunit S [Syntrophomonadaceae bacterium]
MGDLLNFRRGHDLPKKNMVPGTVPVVGSNGVIGYHNSFTTKAPCLTIGRSGNVGNPCFINQDCWAHNTTLYVDNYKGNHPLYLFYLLKTLKLSHLSGGSAVPTLNRNHIHPILIRATVNPLEQRAIAATLSCIDDLIELNNRTNQVLEEMAQAIFKHWFVDFEFPNEDGQPYKSSGGAMADSELGEMPAGWRVEKLGKIVSVTSGKRPNIKTDSKTDEFWVPLVGASSIMGYVNDYLYDEPILVIGRVGTHGIIQRFSRPSWPSDNTLVFKSKYYEFTYQILKNIDYKVFNRGSTQPLITQTDMKNFAIILPPTDVIAIFENIIGSLFVLLNNNKIESDKLGYLRDALLPKLMSGEIRVPVEEVV